MQVNVPLNKGLVVLRKTPKAPATKVIVQNNASNHNKKGRRRRKASIPRGLGSGLSSAYLKCLSDPFTNPPVRLGFGCMVPTSVHTAYLRTSFTITDGSFNLFILPNQNSLMLTNYSGLTNPPIGPAGSGNAYMNTANNVTVLNQVMNSSRTIAMGIRIIPMIPATSVPGVLSLGCAPRASLIDLCANSSATPASSKVGLFNQPTTVVSGMPYLREHMARPGAVDFFQLTWRPTDIQDFQFHDSDGSNLSYQNSVTGSPYYSGATSAGANTSPDSQGSFLVATGIGLPTTASIYVEVILHMECTNTFGSIAATDSSAIEPSLADEGSFPSMESLYRRIAPFLPSPETVAGAASSLLSSPMVRHYAARYAQNSLLGVRSSGYELV